MHKRTIAVACSLLVAMPMAVSSAQEFGGSPAPAGYAKIRHGVVSLKDTVQIPALEGGVVKKLELADGTRIEEGVLVDKDQLLGSLDDRDAAARKRAAELDVEVAEGDTEKAGLAIAAADKTVQVAETEAKENASINAAAPGAVSKTAVRRGKLTYERSAIEADIARHDEKGAQKTAELRQAQVEVATLNLDHHQIKSPIGGEVVQVYLKVGEWVNPGDPIVRIINLETLRVEGFLKIGQHLRQNIKGQPVKVEIQMPGGRTVGFDSTISYVSPLVQASGDYRVVCEVTNRKEDGFWVLLPGMDAELTITVKRSQFAAVR